MNDDSMVLKIGKRAFLISFLIILFLMIFSGIMTKIIPSGEFSRVVVDGREIIETDSFKSVESPDYPVWRWFTAPVEILWSGESLMVIIISIFIIVVGGAFSVLGQTGVIKQLINAVISKFRKSRFLLLSIVVLLFMLFGALMGIFEEVVALVPIMIAFSFSLGWDTFMGLGMSIVATGFGFSAAIANPFTMGVAQKIAGLPLFSGVFFRIVFFIATYIVLLLFLRSYARKIEMNPEFSYSYIQDNEKKNAVNSDDIRNDHAENKKPIVFFICCLSIMFIYIILSSFFSVLSDLNLPVVIVFFLIASIGVGLLSGNSFSKTLKVFVKGITGVAPGIILILMATSVKHIIYNGKIMDTILYHTANAISSTSPYAAAMLSFALVLFLNLFIGSASAKAFLIMPILSPLSEMVGITRQSAVLAFCLGDGFSNLIYPTNAVLLIALGISAISYTKWFKWIFKLQLIMLVFSISALLLSVYLNFGPF